MGDLDLVGARVDLQHLRIAGQLLDPELAHVAVAAVDLDGFERHYPKMLSGGMQQRTAIARAMITQPRMILADEPTGNLDPQHSLEIWNLFEKLNRELGQTFVIVTHDAELAGRSQKRYELRDGILI